MPRGQLLLRATPCLLLVLLGGGLFINVSAEPDEIMENSILRKRAPLAELEDAENSPFQELSRRGTVTINGRVYKEVHGSRLRKKGHHGGGHKKRPHHHPPHHPPHPKPPSPKPPSPPPA
nr:PREDICTED: forkhead box protein B2-like [Bemisia tabaci]